MRTVSITSSLYLSRYDLAFPLYTECLDILLKTLGENHPKVGEVQSGISDVYYTQGNYSEALVSLGKALIIQTNIFGGNHENVARTQAQLGNVHRKKGDYVEAKRMYYSALDIFEKSLGKVVSLLRLFCYLLLFSLFLMNQVLLLRCTRILLSSPE